MKFAREQAGVAVEIFTAKPVFHPSLMATVHEAPDAIATGWVYQDGAWSPPVPVIPTAADLANAAANKRFSLETGGITLGGAVIKTDRESQNLINGAAALLNADPTLTEVSFKAETGFVTFDRTTMIQIAVAVGRHVQRLFAAEAELDAAIASGEVTTLDQIEAWPGWAA
jgi:hypothetical protein